MSMSDHEKVINAIEDRYSNERKASKVGNITDWTELSETKVRDIIDDLNGNQILSIYDGDGDPTVYVTRRMENSISSQVGEPEWIVDYGFNEKVDLQEQIQERNGRVSELQNLERLLYSTGDLLENSIEDALGSFGFDPETTVEDEDMVIRDGDHVYVIEIKGEIEK